MKDRCKIKFIHVLFYALLLVIGCTAIAYAEDHTRANVYVNSEYIDTQAFIVNGRTMVPVRGVFEKLGYDVEWHSDDQQALIYDNDVLLIITKGQDGIIKYTDTEQLWLKPDVPQQIINDRFYIPLRSVSEAVGANVSWDADTKTVNIYAYTAPLQQTQPSAQQRVKITDLTFKSDAFRDYLLNECEYTYADEFELDRWFDIDKQYLDEDMLADAKKYLPLADCVVVYGECYDIMDTIKMFVDNGIDVYTTVFGMEETYIDKTNIDHYIEYVSTVAKTAKGLAKNAGTAYEKALAVHDFMVENFEYDYGDAYGNIPDSSYDPLYALKHGTTVCQGYTEAGMALLIYMGVDCEFVEGGMIEEGKRPVNDYDHAWFSVKLDDGNYYHMDVTWDDEDDGHYYYDYFLVSDTTLSLDHIWDREDYTPCKYDYFD